jgi:anti-sigma factor RsiW
MSHQPYEGWLFGDSPLDEGQAEALRQHLTECAACRSLAEAWDELGAVLRSPELAAPAAGFTERWASRLEQEGERRRRGQAWWALALTAGSGVAASIGLVIHVLDLLHSPALLALRVVEWLSAFAAEAFVLREAIISLAARLPSLVTSSWLFISLGVVALLAAAWAFSIYRYAFQGVRK